MARALGVSSGGLTILTNFDQRIRCVACCSDAELYTPGVLPAMCDRAYQNAITSSRNGNLREFPGGLRSAVRHGHQPGHGRLVVRPPHYSVVELSGASVTAVADGGSSFTKFLILRYALVYRSKFINKSTRALTCWVLVPG